MRIRRYILLLLALAYWVFIFVLTHLPPAQLQGIHVSDKVAHLGAFGMLAALLLLSLWALRPAARGMAWVVFALCLAYAALDEWTQGLVQRTPDRYDWLADSAGVLLAVAGLSLVRWGLRAVCRRPAPVAEPVEPVEPAP